MEKNDKVKIVPNNQHPDYLKVNYGKILKINKVVKTSDDTLFYKLNNIKNYANESDIELV